eukprot:29598-Eustigmatos_ZCMA.PRE.1
MSRRCMPYSGTTPCHRSSSSRQAATVSCALHLAHRVLSSLICVYVDLVVHDADFIMNLLGGRPETVSSPGS